MSVVALWLLAVGLADLARWSVERPSWRRSVIGLLTAAVVALTLALLLGFSAGATMLSASIVTAGVAGWFWTSDRALDRAKRSGWPLTLMLAYVAGLLAATGIAPEPAGLLSQWYAGLQIPPLDVLPLEKFLLGLGALIFLQGTANRITRLMLLGAGTPASLGESTLKGGRIIGPMERTLIFALGATGQLTAATVVLAAKGVLRFPEIRSVTDLERDEKKQADISSVTEYFLIGTLASWLLAFALTVLL